MKFYKYGLMLGTLGLLASCSNDNLEGPGNLEGNPGDAVYITLDFVQAKGSRADNGTPTGSQTTQNATGDEAKIKNVLLVVTDVNDKPLCYSFKEVDKTGDDYAVYDSTPLSLTFEFNSTAFSTLANLTDANVNLYAVCNIPENEKTTYTNSLGSASTIQSTFTMGADGYYWQAPKDGNGFLMSNSAKTSVNLDVIGIKNGKYTATSPLVLGSSPIKVQRAMARLDLSKAQPENALTDNSVKVTFKGISLVNLSKKFYLFKEVGTTGNFKLFDEEISSNYVNDPKTSYTDNDLFYLVKKEVSPMDYTYDSNWSFDNAQITENPTYTMWRYATPNTVTDKDEQKNGKSTGIVFKAEIEATNGTLNTEEGEDLYVYFGKVWGGLTYIKQVVGKEDGACSADELVIKQVYNQAKGAASDDDAIKTNLKNAGLTVYPASEDNKYYCYYYYWVRHNGIGSANDGEMHPMEFGVVRNNIYKIAVTKVSGLGKPGDFEPNPDEEDDPEKGQDPTSAYLTVSVQVDPWEVRTDNVEFE